jgi:UDP-N-acetylglucosamine:LPS N-acetylglucosamine transferase
VRAARRLFAREGVGCVVALGGWPCAPAAWAARRAGVPLAFLVPDAVPGLVVRRLARRAGRLYLADERARAALGAHPGVRVTGPLLRSAALRVRRDPGALGLEPGRRTLFVTGGSLGAAALDERWLLGLEAAVLREPSLTGRLQVLHSVGRGGEDVAARYRRLGVRHRVTPFVQDMGAAYGTADLVLCRAGAGTCAELAAARAPAVLVPYPHHADRQQFHNAAPLVEAGAVVLVEQEALDPAAVQREVLARLFDEPALQGMRAAFPAAPRGGVAETAGDLVRFLGWGD